VGESSNTKRLRSAALLNSRLNWSRLLDASDVSGGCPDGVRLQPQRYQKTKNTRAMATSESAYLRFARMIQPATKLAISWGNRTIRKTIAAATQNSVRLKALRFWH